MQQVAGQELLALAVLAQVGAAGADDHRQEAVEHAQVELPQRLAVQQPVADQQAAENDAQTGPQAAVERHAQREEHGDGEQDDPIVGGGKARAGIQHIDDPGSHPAGHDQPGRHAQDKGLHTPEQHQQTTQVEQASYPPAQAKQALQILRILLEVLQRANALSVQGHEQVPNQ